MTELNRIEKEKKAIPGLCQPVERLLPYLQENGGRIEESKGSDYHFKEFYFKVKCNSEVDVPLDSEIEKADVNKYICKCHWSTVEII